VMSFLHHPGLEGIVKVGQRFELEVLHLVGFEAEEVVVGV